MHACLARSWILERKATTEWYRPDVNLCLPADIFCSGYDTSKEASGEHIQFTTSQLKRLNLVKCVVGDSSTVQHGGPFLKRWMTWLEGNADVRFAEI